jgi:hypothetical protein
MFGSNIDNISFSHFRLLAQLKKVAPRSILSLGLTQISSVHRLHRSESEIKANSKRKERKKLIKLQIIYSFNRFK